MTVNEFITELNKIGASGDDTLKIYASQPGTVGAHGVNLSSVSMGFDWNKGSILIHPVYKLTTEPVAKNERAAR